VTVPTIPGWIEQWYGKVPADEKVILKLPPGAITGELQAPPFAVDVCEIESLLVHVTVPPTGTAIGLGLKAVVVRTAAPGTIDAETVELEDVGDGVDGDDELHATEKPSRSATGAIRQIV
jgi:hypothetical protein